MKTSTALSLALVLILAGCAVTHEPQTDIGLLELVSITPLPPIKTSAHLTGVQMSLLLHVDKDGSVKFVKLLAPTGEDEWDSLALVSIRQWKFAPPLREGVPSDVWARQLVVVQIQEPAVMTIVELALRTRQEADSVFALLDGGVDPETIFGGDAKTIDITTYPPRIREALIGLRIGEWTRPVFVGDSYRLFKRLPGENSHAL